MQTLKINPPKEIINQLIDKNGYFPNNQRHPFIIYRQALSFTNQTTKMVQEFLRNNSWVNSWVNGIYNYDHYHSNNHEVLIIFSGSCTILIGGGNKMKYDITTGDVIIFPAGVSHKNLASSPNFQCIGAYSLDLAYDMNYGKPEEHPRVDLNINHVPLPASDPIYGKNGWLFNYWIK